MQAGNGEASGAHAQFFSWPIMKTLLVSMSRTVSVYGTHPVQYAVLSGRKVLSQGQGVIDEMQAQPGRSLRLSLDSPANLSERLRVRALSRRFVPVLVQRQLTDSGVFTERFRARSRIQWLRQGEAEVDVLAMLEDDAELAQTLLPTQSRPLTHLVPAEAAVAALVGAATAEPVLVHWWRGTNLRSLGVRQGRVVWQRVQAIDAAGEGWRSQLEAVTAMAPLEFSGPHGQVLRLGKGPWAAEGEWMPHGGRELLGRITGLLQEVDSHAVLLQPELYGLAFVPARDSLIVNGYRQRVLAWRLAPLVAGLAATAGALLLGAGLWWHKQADRQLQAVQLEQQAMVSEAQGLQKRYPTAEALSALRSAAWRETALGANLRTDRFLNELLDEMPVGVQVRQLRIERNGAAAQRVRVVNGQPVLATNATASAEKAARAAQLAQRKAAAAQPAGLFTQPEASRRMPADGEPSFSVDLDLVLSGRYADAKLSGEALAERLTRLGRLSDTRLTFEDVAPGAPGARLRTRLTIAAGAF